LKFKNKFSIDTHDDHYIVTITETALELDMIFRSILPGPRTRNHPPPQPSVPVPPISAASSITTGTTQAPGTSNAPFPSKLCTNCGRKGHLVPTCFESGGGMEGQRAEYRRDKSKVIAMLLASLDELFDSWGFDLFTFPKDSPPNPIPLTSLDDHIIMANLSISSTAVSPNENLHRDLYPMRDSSKISSYVFNASTELNHTAYLSFGGRFKLVFGLRMY
jgi:hypothetical protein